MLTCKLYLKVLEKNFCNCIPQKSWAKHRLANNDSSVTWVNKKVPDVGKGKILFYFNLKYMTCTQFLVNKIPEFFLTLTNLFIINLLFYC